MKVLILAAGLGNRLGDLTTDKPKAMVPLNGRPLIDYCLDFIDHPDVTKVGIVGGYKFEILKEHIESKQKDIELFYNPEFRAGSIKTVQAGFSFLDDDFLLMNVDHVYPKRLFSHILKGKRGLTVMADTDRQLVEDDMKVKSDGAKKLLRIRKDLKDFDGGYIGLTYCPKDMIETYKRATIETEEVYGSSTAVEWIIGHLAANDTKVSILSTNGFRWLEVDTTEDLKKAEETLTKQPQFLL